MGYASDQFYNLPTGLGLKDTRKTQNRNNKFAWPGPTRKTLNDEGKMVDHTVDRGFIRMLPITSDPNISVGSWAQTQCFFQFNPQSIRRNVPMRQEMMNPLLQSPEQFAIPVPGNAVFAFDLMFDRTMELNRQPEAPAAQQLTDDQYEQNFARGLYSGVVGDPNKDLFLYNPPSEIGVLHDLRILDQIIGQGISEDMIAYVAARGELINEANNAAIAAGTTSNPSSTSTNTTSSTTSAATTYTYDKSTVQSNLNLNIGNQAFLIPNPVRVVFSSLFMVDGFVNNMDVAFVKFNQAMVPMQAIISVTMQALYIGFARKNTFLTESLSRANLDTGAITNKTQARETIDYVSAPGSDLTSFRITMKDCLLPVGSPTNPQQAPWRSTTLLQRRSLASGGVRPYDVNFYGGQLVRGATSEDNDAYVQGDNAIFAGGTALPVSEYKNIDKYFPGVCGEQQANFYFGFPLVPDNLATNLTSQSPTAYDAINSDWENNTAKIKSITYQWSVAAWRKPVTSRNETANVKIVEWISEAYSAADATEWKSIRHNDKPVSNSVFSDKNSGRKLYSGVTDQVWVESAYADVLKPVASGGTGAGGGGSSASAQSSFWVDISVTVTVNDGAQDVIFTGSRTNIPISLDGAFSVDISLNPPTIT